MTPTGALPSTPHAAFERIEVLPARPRAAIDPARMKIAVEHSVRDRIQSWDACPIAAADSLRVPRLPTEDFNHGQSYGSIAAINPFRPT